MTHILPSQGNLGEVENGKGHFFRGNYWEIPFLTSIMGRVNGSLHWVFGRLTKCKIYSSMVTFDNRVRHGTKRCSHSITCGAFCKNRCATKRTVEFNDHPDNIVFHHSEFPLAVDLSLMSKILPNS